jgi:hypothetical protein
MPVEIIGRIRKPGAKPEWAVAECEIADNICQVSEGKEVYRGGWHKPNLISASIAHDTFGNETSLQLRMPVWQCDTKRLKQAGVRKN